MNEGKVAQEILKQLGGRIFTLMTGSYNLTYTENSLVMTLKRNLSKAKWLQIVLENDTYTLIFSKLQKGEFIVVKEIKDVYNTELQSIFTEVTGLKTSL